MGSRCNGSSATTGLHFADIERLIDVLHPLVDQGNSVVIIGFETLADRMVSEAVANGSVLVAWFDVAAWSRV